MNPRFWSSIAGDDHNTPVPSRSNTPVLDIKWKLDRLNIEDAIGSSLPRKALRSHRGQLSLILLLVPALNLATTGFNCLAEGNCLCHKGFVKEVNDEDAGSLKARRKPMYSDNYSQR